MRHNPDSKYHMRHNKNSKFVSATQAAEILSVTSQAVRDFIEDEKLLGSFKAGSFWVIPRKEVMKLKKQRESERDETK